MVHEVVGGGGTLLGNIKYPTVSTEKITQFFAEVYV